MLQLKNNTPFFADFTLFPNEKAIDALYILVKATFNIGHQWTLANEQLPATKADVYYSDSESSSIKYVSDYHCGKTASDVIMLGHACAPNGQVVSQLDVRLRVGKTSKVIRVFGERQWHDGLITSAKPFKSMPMVYENAYGGSYKANENIFSQTDNPVGLGFVGQRSKEQMNGLPLPHLEDPKHLITGLNDQPQPACFAASASHWLPRSRYAGTYDEQWEINRSPYLPFDFDKRFFNAAHPDLIYPGFLKGGELVEITNMHPQADLKFAIPHVSLSAEVHIAGDIFKPVLNLETLLLEPNDLSLSMVWHASLACDKKTMQINQIKINRLG